MSTRRTTRRRYTSVWNAISETRAEAEHMKLRSDLMMALTDFIEREEMSQAQAAELFGVTQPRISDLIRGKIKLFSLDSLVAMATSAGMRVQLKIAKAA